MQSRGTYSKITIRQPKRLKARIARAAALRGMTVTSFINGALERAAESTIKRVTERELSERDSLALLAMLQTPAPPNAALREAVKQYGERNRGRTTP
jgi:uncharacterized protein (DUF1778 family)